MHLLQAIMWKTMKHKADAFKQHESETTSMLTTHYEDAQCKQNVGRTNTHKIMLRNISIMVLQ